MPDGRAERLNMKATVEAMDASIPSVTFCGREGPLVEVNVSDDPRIFSRSKIGETYNVSPTESLTVAVTNAPGG